MSFSNPDFSRPFLFPSPFPSVHMPPPCGRSLIDACGRCGDTGRATQLLSRMHEDGIVADGVVYSSLVSAFSAENAWKQASGEVRDELPGE